MCFYVDLDGGTDSVFYIQSLKEMHISDITFESLSGLFYKEGERYYDIFEPIVTFVVSRFTDDYRIFMAVIGFTYGFFYSRVIYFAINRLNRNTSLLEWFLLSALVFSIDVGRGINGVRFGLAQVVFLWGVLQYLESRKNVHFGLAALSVLFHFSFFFPVGILFAERFVSKIRFPIFVFFLASFVVAEIDLAVIRSFVSYIPGLGDRVGGYISDREGEFRELTWLIDINHRMTQAFMILTMSYFYLTFVSRNVNRFSTFCIFAMLLYGCVNIAHQVGSIYRFYVTAEVIAICYVLLQFNWYRKESQEVAGMGAVAAALLSVQLALGIRFFLGFATTNLAASNPIIVWFMQGNESLFQYVPRFW
jgi:hypothetical protein